MLVKMINKEDKIVLVSFLNTKLQDKFKSKGYVLESEKNSLKEDVKKEEESKKEVTKEVKKTTPKRKYTKKTKSKE